MEKQRKSPDSVKKNDFRPKPKSTGSPEQNKVYTYVTNLSAI